MIDVSKLCLLSIVFSFLGTWTVVFSSLGPWNVLLISHAFGLLCLALQTVEFSSAGLWAIIFSSPASELLYSALQSWATTVSFIFYLMVLSNHQQQSTSSSWEQQAINPFVSWNRKDIKVCIITGKLWPKLMGGTSRTIRSMLHVPAKATRCGCQQVLHIWSSVWVALSLAHANC